MYLGPVGAPLYCDTPLNPLAFSPDTTPFIALPVEFYLDGSVQCGDPFVLTFADGTILVARAYDAGPFSRYCVLQPDGSCPSIAADVPAHLWPVEGISGFVKIQPLEEWAAQRGLYVH